MFKNILFVVYSNQISDDVLKRAASLSFSNNGKLSFLVLHPKFPEELIDSQAAFQKTIEDSIREKLKHHNINEASPIVFQTSSPEFVAIIQFVLKNEIDLVIKSSEPLDAQQHSGFKSLDMHLLRKCPCAVWIHRDFHTDKNPQILVAIDPLSDRPEGHDLSIKLLQLSYAVNAMLNGTIHVISCWHFEHESFLKHSAFGKTDAETLTKLLDDTRLAHKESIDALFEESKIEKPGSLILKKGKANEEIPEYIETHKIDMVVMGTVARNGIPGFIIGNTAENILQQLTCGMLALKPNGFVSPVKAYY